MLSVHRHLSVLVVVLVTGPWTSVLDLGSSLCFPPYGACDISRVSQSLSLSLGPVVVEVDAGVQADCEESMKS